MFKINFNWKIFLKIASLFVLAQIIGVWVAYKLVPDLVSVQPGRISDFNLYDLAILAVLVAIFIFAVRKFKKAGAAFFKIFLTVIIYVGSQTTLGIWFGPAASTVATVVILVLFWFFNNVFMQNIAMLLTFAGVGAVIGLSLTPETSVLLLVAFSFYDILAVYKTKHMIKLAESMIESRAIFGFVVPEILSGVKEKISKVVPGGQFMILGSGDVILPLVLSASLVRVSLFQSVFVVFFSVLGLLLMHLIFTNQKIRRPMAALPPIATMAIIGYLVALFVI